MPRGRAAREVGRVRFWPKVKEGPVMLGFTGYKAGMIQTFSVEDMQFSPNFGKEVVHPATVVDVPPVLVCGVRAYVKNEYGSRSFTEAWMKDPPKDLGRVITLSKNPNPDKELEKMERNIEIVTEFRLFVATQPKLAGVPKKKPDLMEIKIDGNPVREQYVYARSLLGKTVSISDVFKEGQFVDVISITKGKGWQGPVKRWGIKIRSHKSRKTRRGVGTLGPWKPSRVLYSVPRAGQMGYHHRTEFNKRILKIGIDGDEVSPKGGFLRYGPVRGNYVLLDGSVPGPAKRLIRLRYPARLRKGFPDTPPNITYISLKSPQG